MAKANPEDSMHLGKLAKRLAELVTASEPEIAPFRDKRCAGPASTRGSG